jgi:all-trans-retinol dehydrogenase (NAD+)
LDVGNYASVEACRANIERDLGPVDILVNNAGILPLASLREGKPSDLERIINVNLTAHIWVSSKNYLANGLYMY